MTREGREQAKDAIAEASTEEMQQRVSVGGGRAGKGR